MNGDGGESGLVQVICACECTDGGFSWDRFLTEEAEARAEVGRRRDGGVEVSGLVNCFRERGCVKSQSARQRILQAHVDWDVASNEGFVYGEGGGECTVIVVSTHKRGAAGLRGLCWCEWCVGGT